MGRDKRLNIRLTEDELEQVKEQAQHSDLALSDFARECLLNCSVNQPSENDVNHGSNGVNQHGEEVEAYVNQEGESQDSDSGSHEGTCTYNDCDRVVHKHGVCQPHWEPQCLKEEKCLDCESTNVEVRHQEAHILCGDCHSTWALRESVQEAYSDDLPL